MSKEQLKSFLEQVKEDTMRERLKLQKLREFLDIAKEYNYQLTADVLKD
ncbi:Nif11-like leader peptide family natural product precursor [Synechococcus sp. UW179A]|nr:Nif11-like leader peptide family natural product precursor [Synechococcus sp. UW179A]